MPAGIYNILSDQGSTFARTLVYKDSNGTPIDLSGYTAKMEIRPTIGSSTLLLTLSTANGRITLGGAAGTITLNVASGDMGFDPGSYAYDLEVTSGGGVTTRVVMGQFVQRGEVTK